MVVVLVFSSIQKKLNVYSYLSIDQFCGKNEAKSIKFVQVMVYLEDVQHCRR